MKGYAKTTLGGNIATDPETRQVGDSSLVTFTLAVNKKRGDQEKVSWFKCEAWDKIGEIISKFCAKGSPVFLETEPYLDQWEDDQGNKKSMHKFTVRELVLAGGSQDS